MAAWFESAFSDEPAIQLFEVPIIGGFAKLGKWFIDSGMRSGTPKEMHDHVLTAYSGSGRVSPVIRYGSSRFRSSFDKPGKE